MKKFTFSFVLLGALTINAQAQRVETKPQSTADVGMEPIRQGNWIVGGSIGNIGHSFEGDAFNINLNARAGYIVSDCLAIGAQASLCLTAIEDQDNVYKYGISPSLRYYFPG